MLIVVPSVIAPPAPAVTQVPQVTFTLDIANPKFENYALGTDFKMHFHVYNSTGALVTPLSRCFFHLYNNTGNHLLTTELEKETGDTEFEIILNNTVIASKGSHTFITWCNTTTPQKETGFLSSSFEITNEGVSIPEDLSPLAALIFIPLIFSLLCVLITFALEDGHFPIKLFLLLMSFLGISVSYNYAITIVSAYYLNNSIVELVASDYIWFAYVIYVVIVYFLLYWFKHVIETLAGKKDAELKFHQDIKTENGKK